MITKTKLLIFILICILKFNIIAQEEKQSITPQSIIDKYINALGGREKMEGIFDRTTVMRGTAMEQSITIVIKQKFPNKFRQEIKVAGMDQVIIFNGEKAIIKVADQTMDILDEQLEQLKIEGAMDLMWQPEKYGVSFAYDGNELFDQKKYQILNLTTKNGEVSKLYFDDESGLKVKEIKSVQSQMGKIQQTIEYSDYKEINGVMFPHKLKQSFGPQTIELNVSSIKVNTNLSDDIFNISE